MRCPRCQHENPSAQKFCGECGTPLTDASSTERSYADPKSEVESLRQALAESLEQQTATAEILRVIADRPPISSQFSRRSSPTRHGSAKPTLARSFASTAKRLKP